LNGLAAIRCSAFIARNTGLSLSLRRIHSETASSTIEITNGMRQPQALNWSGLSSTRHASTTPTLSTNPPTTPAWMKLV